MGPHIGKLMLTLAIVVGFTLPAQSQAGPAVWFSPDNDTPDYLDLFNKPEAWSTTRAQVNVFKFGPQQVSSSPAKVNSYAELLKADAFRKLKEWRIEIAIEAPAVKEWNCTGVNAAKVTLEYIRNVRAAGAAVSYIAMDEPLVSGFRACHLTFEETAARTAAYVKAVSEDKTTAASGQKVAFGDTEPYPSYSVDQLRQWIDSMERNGFKPAFFHLDVDINNIELHPNINLAKDLGTLKAYLRQKEIPLGIVFWSGHDPEKSDEAYYYHVIDYVTRIKHAIQKPDQSVFQSWVNRVSSSCSDRSRCTFSNPACSAEDPDYCGMKSVPINLPDYNIRVYSHTRLIVDSLRILVN